MPESHGYYGGAKAGETLVQRLYRQAGTAIEDAANSAGRYISKRLDTQLYPEDMQQFQAAPPEQYALFLEATWQAMDMPVVKMGDQVLSPEQYLRLAAARSNLPESAINTAMQSIAGMPFDEKDEAGIALRDALLGQMRDNLPGRHAESGWDAGATPEQVAEFDKLGPLESRYQLTPEGEQGYQSERVYNLFSTFQNGEHAPVWSDAGSKVLGVLGAPFDTHFGGFMGDTSRLAGSRFNTPTGRLSESMYWWHRGQPDGTVATSGNGAKYPSLSATTLEGATTKLDSTDHYIPYYNQHLIERYLYNLDLDAGDRGQLQRMRDDLFRTTPRYPAGADPRDMRKLIRDLRDFDQKARGFANAEYPEFVRNTIPIEAWTSGGHDWMGRYSPSQPSKPVEPTYLSPFGEMLANYPRDAVDLQTILTLGVGGLKGSPSLLGGLMDASKAGTKAVVRKGVGATAGAIRRSMDNTLDDLVQEVPTNAAMQAANQPGPTRSTSDAISWFFTPMETSIVTDEAGQPVKANDPNYRRHLDATYQRRQSELRGLLDRGTTLYGREHLTK